MVLVRKSVSDTYLAFELFSSLPFLAFKVGDMGEGGSVVKRYE